VLEHEHVVTASNYVACRVALITHHSLSGGKFLLDHTNIVFELLKLHSKQRLSQHFCYLFIARDILELHCSLMYHLSNIMVLDLDMLGPIITHWVF
jgi:hypothetical protein